MLNFNQQFLDSMSHYLDEKVEDRKQLVSRQFTSRDMELFARQYYEDMSQDDMKKDLRVMKIFYFSMGVIAVVVVFGLLIFNN